MEKLQENIIVRINTLIDDNVLTENISQVGLVTRKITRTGEAAIKRLEPVTSFRVLYSYEERPNVPEAASGSRPLCNKLFNSDGKGKSQVSTLAALDMSSGTGCFKDQSQPSMHVWIGGAIAWIAVVKHFFGPIQAANFVHVFGEVGGKLWVDVVVIFARHDWVF